VSVSDDIPINRTRRNTTVPNVGATYHHRLGKLTILSLYFVYLLGAHQNTLETLPLTLFYILFSGIKYPTAAAGLGAAVIVGRIIYTIGYSTGVPVKV